MSDVPFIGRDDLSDYLGQDLSASDKALICVDAACATVRTLAEQNFNAVANETIKLDGTGTDSLLLPERPVTAVSNVTEGTTVLVVTTDYKLNGNGVLLRMSSEDEDGNTTYAKWTKGRQNVSVTYSHGYSEVPRDVRIAALSIASRLFQQQGGAVTEESLGAYRVRYAGAGSDITANEVRILRKYRQSR